tara:strand:+ start:85 stop:339 length:255 start_codon:yes stop_codon:yes gene_type:complete
MNADQPDGWDWFEESREPGTATQVQDAFVRAFASDAGRQVLAFLRQITIDRRLPPDAPEPLLRFVEGQRGLVAQIERLAAPKPQ